MIKLLYKILSIFNTLSAASKGPSSLGKQLVRRSAHKQLAKGLRKWL